MTKTVVIIAGTRPEVIKLASVYHELSRLGIKVQLWLTGQHRDLTEGPVSFFKLKVARRLSVHKKGQTLNQLLSKTVLRIDQELSRTQVAAVIVQGDTTSALAGAIAAFHRGIPVAHVEAGLRTGDLNAPFPEEMNRRVIDAFAYWHFPPTQSARRALSREGHERVPTPTGNTGIDALYWARNEIRKENYWPRSVPRPEKDSVLILSTGHRRENFGGGLYRVLSALGREVKRRKNVVLIHVLHPNPLASEEAVRALSGIERVHLVDPLDYADLIALLDRAQLVVSDSGGLQEEAPSFGIPILITREVTERPEVLSCGGTLVGTDPKKLSRALNRALDFKKGNRSSKATVTPFGDGKAKQRIVRKILADLSTVP